LTEALETDSPTALAWRTPMWARLVGVVMASSPMSLGTLASATKGRPAYLSTTLCFSPARLSTSGSVEYSAPWPLA
jgi:hypothetical protein